MILGFKKSMGFKERILSSLGIKEYQNHKPKRHTIREDKHGRWKQGRMIQACYGVRTKQFEKFAEMPCLGIQKIKITWILIKDDKYRIQVEVDGKDIGYEGTQILAINDGFDSIEDFLLWFNKDFEGKIIHWTNHIRY